MTDKTKPTQEARQGKTGLNVRYVLVASIAAAIIALALVAGVTPTSF